MGCRTPLQHSHQHHHMARHSPINLQLWPKARQRHIIPIRKHSHSPQDCSMEATKHQCHIINTPYTLHKIADPNNPNPTLLHLLSYCDDNSCYTSETHIQDVITHIEWIIKIGGTLSIITKLRQKASKCTIRTIRIINTPNTTNYPTSKLQHGHTNT